MLLNKLILVLILWQDIFDYFETSISLKKSEETRMFNLNQSFSFNENKLVNDRHHTLCQALNEFSCKNGNCILLSKYCDGANDCGDNSDESLDCTKCNRTYYGQINSKYSVYFKEPVEKFHFYYCQVNFVANGAKFGDFIELTFFSFLVGSFVLKKSSSTCEYGYLKINEESLNLTHTAGNFCGQMMARKTIYYSEGSKLNLQIYLPERRAFYKQYLPLNVYLTYRFLPSNIFYNISDSKIQLGAKVLKTYCDYTFDHCLSPKNCKIFSPNYPGFYPRNITCQYLIHQKHDIPQGYKALVSVSQSNEYKINIQSDLSSSVLTSKAKGGLVSDCELDSISIYNGLNLKAPKLVQFCGSGHLPSIVSSSNQMLIVFKSVANGSLINSRFELEIEIKLIKITEFQVIADKKSICDYVFRREKSRRGMIKSYKQAIPSNTRCSYQIVSNRPTDKVWIQFMSYFVQDLNQWSSEEKCSSSKLEIFEKVDNQKANNSQILTSSFQLLGKFCEKTLPKICGRLFKNLSYPIVPCTYPKESYLSKGPALILYQTHFKPFDLYSISSHFSIIYEFIDTLESGEPIIGTLCDRRFISSKHPKGVLRSTQNVFYYGRGGNPNLSCSYYFSSKSNEKLKIHLTSLKLKSINCNQIAFHQNNSYHCELTSFKDGQLSSLNIFESISGELINIACFCQSSPFNLNQNSITFNLIGTSSVINFTVTGMDSFQDFDDFNFEVNFKFLPNECNVNKIETRNKNKGEIIYSVPSEFDLKFTSEPIRCRWVLVPYPGQQLSFKFWGYNAINDTSCLQKNRYIVYMGNFWRPVVTICSHNITKSVLKQAKNMDNPSESTVQLDSTDELFYPSSIDQFNSSILKVIIEVISYKSGDFKFQWTRVKNSNFRKIEGQTLRNTNCAHKCPEINSCISPDFLCDGVNHCPSGFDESEQFCEKISLFWILCILGALTLILSLILFYVIHEVILKRRNTNNANSNICSTIDGNETSNYMLSSLQGITSPLQEFELIINNEQSFRQKERRNELKDDTIYYSHSFQQLTMSPSHRARSFGYSNQSNTNDHFLYF